MRKFRISYCTKVNGYAGMLCRLALVSYNNISEASVMKCTVSAHTGAYTSQNKWLILNYPRQFRVLNVFYNCGIILNQYVQIQEVWRYTE